ncbi:MAG: peptidylprolyl isomerase [Ignavibacteria bacterium]|nr:peptidylprolyl isomerase [Ignavibacteria bacterium]
MLRKSKNILVPIIIFGALAFQSLNLQIFAQPFTEEEKFILRNTDLRNPGIIKYDFSNLRAESDPKNYSVQFLSLLNLADSALADSLISHYEGSTLSNKLQILTLLGYFDFQNSRDFLSGIVQNSDSPEIVTAAGISLGNIAKQENIDQLAQMRDEFRTEGTIYRMQFSKAAALLMLAKRRLSNENVIAYINGKTEDALVNGYDHTLAYIYFRAGTKDNLQGSRDELLKLLLSENAYTRMWAFAALGKMQLQGELAAFEDALKKDKDWRVRVNIINALGNMPADINSPLASHLSEVFAETAAKDESEHVRIVSLQALGKLMAGLNNDNRDYKELRRELRAIINSGAAWQVKAEAIKTLAKIFRDNAKNELFALFAKADSYDLKAAIVSSFGSMNDPLVYKMLRDTISADVMKYNEIHPNKDGSMIGSNDLAKLYRGFVSALTGLDDKMDAENRNIIRLILSEFASSKDPLLTDICLTNLQDSIYMQYRNETCQIMTFDYQNFKLPQDRDAAMMYIMAWGDMNFEGAKDILTANLKSDDYEIAKTSADALKKITGTDHENEITALKFHTDPDWNYIDNLNSKKFVSLKTNKGLIKLELYPDAAPFTVQNFIKLAEIGYYDNTIFHRVVPNFVIQGGDPTGTGYSGPGYSIRSEFSPLSFAPYTVGMASSGRDTEGSQFFITHSPQPHLDGKYTLFGRVTEGFEVVDKIQAGDKIESVTISSE